MIGIKSKNGSFFGIQAEKKERKKIHAKIKRLEAIMVCNRIFFAHVRILAMGRV